MSELPPDFVLVYNQKSLNEESFKQLATFAENLEKKGLQLTTATLTGNPDVVFIKIFGPNEVLSNLAKIFKLELSYEIVHFKSKTKPLLQCMSTVLTEYSPGNRINTRTVTDLSHEPKTLTAAERSLIIFKVLAHNAFGPNSHEIGVEKLVNQGALEAAFPLHDGPNEWSNSGPVSDRQLLQRFWSSIRAIHKSQPIDFIERYYGPEVAFYFTWLGFYNKMLVIAAVFGILFLVLGALFYWSDHRHIRHEVCSSTQILCPRCLVQHCSFGLMRHACLYSDFLTFLDNALIVTYAGLMSIWSTVFLEIWRRKEATLQIRWNLRSLEVDYSMRPEFEEKVKSTKYSPVTDQMELYIPTRVKIYRSILTASSILLLIIVMALGLFGVTVYVKAASLMLTQSSQTEIITKNASFIASITGSCMSVAFIFIFELIYERVALWLTRLEIPRTQFELDSSYTHKCYAISFVNYYAAVFYIAFFKGRFYTHPGDEKIWRQLRGLRSDLCGPGGCMIELAIQIIIILLAKNLVLTLKQYIVPRLIVFYNKFLYKKRAFQRFGSQWEADYVLNSMGRYFLMQEYRQMVIQYGFVTLFIAAFPPAPFLALLNNILELRIDALKLTKSYRRPVAFKVNGIGAWTGIIQTVTYLGVATNALVIALTSDFIDRHYYEAVVNKDLIGYNTWLFSEFNTSEFPKDFQVPGNISTCWYPGKRNPPSHSLRYQLRNDYWIILALKLIFVLAFENIVMIVTGIVAYSIPDIPFTVKEHIKHEKDKLKEAKLKVIKAENLRRTQQDDFFEKKS